MISVSSIRRKVFIPITRKNANKSIEKSSWPNQFIPVFNRAINTLIFLLLLLSTGAIQPLQAQTVGADNAAHLCAFEDSDLNSQLQAAKLNTALSCFVEAFHWSPNPLNPKGPYFPKILQETEKTDRPQAIDLLILSSFHQMIDEHEIALTLLRQAGNLSQRKEKHDSRRTKLLNLLTARSLIVLGRLNDAREILTNNESNIQLTASMADHLLEAERQDTLGFIYAHEGNWEQAEHRRRQAMNITHQLSADNGQIAMAEYENNLGVSLLFQNRFSEAERLLRGSLKSRKLVFPEDHPAIAESDSNLSTLYFKKGQLTRSLEHNSTGSRIYQKNFQTLHRTNIEMANNRATILAGMGLIQQSVTILEAQCNAISEKYGQLNSLLANCLHNRGSQRSRLGNLEAALQDLTGAMEILKSLYPRPHPSTANTLDSLGLVYGSLGNRTSQTDYLSKALEMRRALPSVNDADIAFSLHNLGYAAAQRADYSKAKTLFTEALELRTGIFENSHADVVLTRTNLGFVLLQLSDAVGGMKLQQDALIGMLDAENQSPANMAVVLNNLGLTAAALTQPIAAEEYFLQALALLTADNFPELRGHIQYNLASNLRKQGSLNLAIFLQKQAVSSIANIHRMLDEQHRMAYLRSNDALFKHLAKWLIEDGRIAEANDVLDLLDEYQTDQIFERSDSQFLLYISEAENRLKERFGSLQKSISDQINSRFERSEESSSGWLFSPDASSKLNTVWQNLKTNLPKKKLVVQQECVDQERNRTGNTLLTKEDAASKGPNNQFNKQTIVRIRYLVFEDHVQLLVDSGNTFRNCHISVTSKLLAGQISSLRDSLLQTKSNPSVPTPRANSNEQQLYQLLFKPADDFIDELDSPILVIDTDSFLSFLPITALYDGEQYLGEKHTFVISKGKQEFEFSTLSGQEIAGFGLSNSHSVLRGKPLPWVGVELNQIIKEDDNDEGIIPGALFLNDQFTTENYIDAVTTGAPIVHVTGHFDLVNNSLKSSYFHAGDGEFLFVEDLLLRRNQSSSPLIGIETMVLPSCDTALPSQGILNLGTDTQRSDRIYEGDGLASAAIRAGAKSVLASLWRVDDASTAIFVQSMYALVEQGYTHAEALKETRTKFINNHIQCSDATQSQNQLFEQYRQNDTDAQDYCRGNWSHPYHWAALSLYVGSMQ